MKLKLHYIIAVFIVLIGFGGLFGYDLYIKPYVLSEKVVKVKVSTGDYLPKNHKLESADLYLDSVETKDVPKNAIRDISSVKSKILNVNISDGVILTDSLVDVDALEPNKDEGIFPIPKEAIYSINGTLRSRDKVDIYLVKNDPQKMDSVSGTEASLPQKESENLDLSNQSIFLSGVTVNYVRTEDNNDVVDTENGNDNNRFTSTGKVSSPELKLKKSDGQLLVKYLEQGMKLWIVRVE